MLASEVKMSAICGTASSETNCTSCLAPLEELALKCSRCYCFMHLHCSGFSEHLLVRFATSQVKFQCGTCIASDLGEEAYSLQLSKVKSIMEKEKLSIEAAAKASEAPTLDNLINPTNILNESRGGLDGLDDTSNDQSQTADLVVSSPEYVRNNVQTVSMPNSSSASTAILCRFYMRKQCKHGRKGDGCKFAHPKLCLKYTTHGDMKGGCKKGSDCNFAHPQLCKGSLKTKQCIRKKCSLFHVRGTKVGVIPSSPSTQGSNNVRSSPPITGADQQAGPLPSYASAVREHPGVGRGTGSVECGVGAVSAPVPSRDFLELKLEMEQIRSLLMRLLPSMQAPPDPRLPWRQSLH